MRPRTQLAERLELLVLGLCLVLATGCASGRGRSPVGSPPPSSPVASPPAQVANEASPEEASSPTEAVAETTCPLCVDANSAKLREAYAAALADARVPEPSEISRDLTPLLPTTEGLVWNEQGQILMISWTNARYFSDPVAHTPGASFTLPVDMWLFAAPFVQDFCRELGLEGPMLNLRLEQLIGLPPNRGKDAFVEIWVDPVDLFRPCPDPEITDHECQVEVPVVDRDAERPWDCTVKRQVSGKFVTVHPGHLRWMCDNWADSYGHEKLYDNYPWTALGYTYDWGNPRDHRGPSEYVAPRGSDVVFYSLQSTERYCSN